MTLTTNERDRLRQALGAYVEETPPAPAWGSWGVAPQRPRRALTGPVVAVASAVLVIGLIGGVAAILRGTGPETGSSVAPEVTETWGDWYQRIVAGGELNGRDPSILQGAARAEPGFDTNSLGFEQTIEPVSQQLGEVDWNALVGDHLLVDRSTLVVAGRVGSSVAGVVRARQEQDGSRLVDDGVCLVVASEDASGGWASALTCRSYSGPVTFGTDAEASPLRVSLLVADDAFAVAVPPGAAVVAVDTGTQRYWQVPRGGVALFSGDLVDEITYVIYSESGDQLARGSTQPSETVVFPPCPADVTGYTGSCALGSDLFRYENGRICGTGSLHEGQPNWLDDGPCL